MHTSKRSAMSRMIALVAATMISNGGTMGSVVNARAELSALQSRTRHDAKDRNSGGNRVSQAKRRKYARQGR